MASDHKIIEEMIFSDLHAKLRAQGIFSVGEWLSHLEKSEVCASLRGNKELYLEKLRTVDANKYLSDDDDSFMRMMFGAPEKS